jgi:hypothetical protein
VTAPTTPPTLLETPPITPPSPPVPPAWTGMAMPANTIIETVAANTFALRVSVVITHLAAGSSVTLRQLSPWHFGFDICGYIEKFALYFHFCLYFI